MKNTITIMIVILFIGIPVLYSKDYITPLKTNLTGRITDKNTGETLVGVSVYIPDLKTGTISSIDGTYEINNLPSSKVLVQVSYLGYKLIAETIDLSKDNKRDFAMEVTVAELHEIVITGLSQASEKSRTPTPITTIPRIQLLQVSSTNIIDALAKQPGISQITTGAGISKPVIRGLGYNRVVVVNDGIRQEGQQWGDEHGVEIDEFSVNRAEILKGPASLSYGSDAIAGVVNLISAQTLPEGKIEGNILANYQTNNGLIAYSANLAGNKNGFIWDLRYSNKMAHAFTNKYDGYVYNSGFNENNFSGIIGINKSSGYSHLHFSIYNLTPGIVEGERDSASGKFIKPVNLNDAETSALATENDFNSYTPQTPYQKIHHYKAILNSNFIVGDGSIKSTIGFQQNQRQEYADILNKDHYGLYFLLNTINYDVRYILPEVNNYNISFGINGMKQKSQNNGTEFLVPEYDLFDLGAFGIIKKTIGNLDIIGGLRYDTRNQKGKDLYLDSNGAVTSSDGPNTYHQFTAFNSTFSGISGSIGASYQLSDKAFTKFNISRGFRAPNIGEIGANGVHDGTIRFEIGNPTLKSENSLQLDYALGFNTNHVTAEIDLFDNNIDNFIFSRKLNSVMGGDSLRDGYETYKFNSGNAHLLGGEIMIDIHPHPLDWLHFQNSFSYVHSILSNQADSSKYLPFTPAAKFSTELRANATKLNVYFANAYFTIGLDHYFKQNDIYAAGGTETPTPAYTLINLGFGADVLYNKKVIYSLYFSINNLTDIAYQSHLSRLKYGELNNVTGRIGVYNMGRNVSIKLMVPFNFSKKAI